MLTYKDVYVPPCGNFFIVSPNPAATNVTVSTDDSKMKPGENKTFDEVSVYDFQDTPKKYQTFNKIKTTIISTSGLPTGTYFIEIINGDYKETHQILIQK